MTTPSFRSPRLATLVERPVERAPAVDGVHRVDPDLVCEVGCTEWTRARRLRHPRYLGLRDDRAPEDVSIELPEDIR